MLQSYLTLHQSAQRPIAMFLIGALIIKHSNY
jgi:hypothetical protein